MDVWTLAGFLDSYSFELCFACLDSFHKFDSLGMGCPLFFYNLTVLRGWVLGVLIVLTVMRILTVLRGWVF